MKKLLFLAIFVIASVCSVNAQVKEEIQKCNDRAAKLEKICKDYKTCGVDAIDALGNEMKDVALFAVANTEQLDKMYKLQTGESTDGTVPTIDDWINFSKTIEGEVEKIKGVVEKAKDLPAAAQQVVSEATNISNPLKAGKAIKKGKKAVKVADFVAEAGKILGEESAAQVKIVGSIIADLKAGKTI